MYTGDLVGATFTKDDKTGTPFTWPPIHSAELMVFGNITLAARALEVCVGGGRAYLCIELWIDGRRGERWARAQTVWDGEEFETFTVRGLILRTNHPRSDGYLEGGEASQMLCGKHHIFSNACVCAKWCVIYNASIDRHGLPRPHSFGV